MKNQTKNPILGAKMFKIAEHLNELNNKRDVKYRAQNNYGHAKAHQIVKGCAIWVHHTFANTLIIDLLISPNAQEKFSTDCDLAIQRFNNFFDIKPIKDYPYYIPSMPDIKHTSYSIDITKENKEKIFKILDDIKDTFL